MPCNNTATVKCKSDELTEKRTKKLTNTQQKTLKNLKNCSTLTFTFKLNNFANVLPLTATHEQFSE